MRRHPDGTPDPAGAITSQSTRGFTGHEHLAEVGLIHMNGRVYDPLLARFGTPDPMTENPFSTQGWNRYSYVGNSPVNFTDPSGYCFLGCFWKPIFKAIQRVLQKVPILGAIIRVAATAICAIAPGCQPFLPAIAGLSSAAVAGITSGNLGVALRAGITAFATAVAFNAVGDITPSGSLGNIVGHAAVGCASAVAEGGKCGSGALSAGVTAFVGPVINGRGFSVQSLVANAVLGGVASVAGGGKFENGAVTAAFGYLFNQTLHDRQPNPPPGTMGVGTDGIPYVVTPPREVTPEIYKWLGGNLTDAVAIGSALKTDPDHYLASFLRPEAAANGNAFFVEKSQYSFSNQYYTL